jgi:hypothetical protein
MNRNKQGDLQAPYLDVPVLKEFLDKTANIEPKEQIDIMLKLLEFALPKLIIPIASPSVRKKRPIKKRIAKKRALVALA